MFEAEIEKISIYRKTRKIHNIVWPAIRLAIAYALMTYVDFGVFIVIGYILYALENSTGIQFINSQEMDLQFNVLHQRINELESKINED